MRFHHRPNYFVFLPSGFKHFALASQQPFMAHTVDLFNRNQRRPRGERIATFV
nr:MAG TPA: hypothetical protein [Caudoviricetes sp.]